MVLGGFLCFFEILLLCLPWFLFGSSESVVFLFDFEQLVGRDVPHLVRLIQLVVQIQRLTLQGPGSPALGATLFKRRVLRDLRS